MQRTTSNRNSSILILYGSQTGTAEGLARRLYALLSPLTPDPIKLFSMDQYDVQQLRQEHRRVVILVSTFATGDFPESAKTFWRGLSTEEWDTAALAHMDFTLFALGNAHSAEHYNAAAKKLDRRLQELGAKHFYIVGYGNELDEDGHDTAFIPWCNGLKVKLGATLHATVSAPTLRRNSSGSLTSPSPASPQSSLPYSVHTLPYQRPSTPGYTNVQLVSNILVTPKDFERGVYYCELSLEDTPLRYKLCDYVAIMPRNKRGLVQGFLDYLGLLGDTQVVVTPQLGGPPLKIPQPIRLCDLFECYLDLFSRPSKFLMAHCANYATNDEEKKILHRISANSSEWELFQREHYTIVDVLMSYSSIKFGLPELVSFVPFIKPRLYSICCSPKDKPLSLFFVYGYRNWRTPSGRNIKGGTCTNFLSQVTPFQEPISIAIKRGTVKYSRRHAPHPIVFVALGTGVGTALAILRERKHLKQSGVPLGPMILYFSGRNKDRDFLFQRELETDLENGILTHLITTFAYDSQPPQFIQVKIREDPKLLWSYLAREECMYVYCGLGGPIPDQIEDCIRDCVASCADIDATKIRAHISQMKANKLWIVENHTTISLKNSPAEGLLESTELHEEIAISPTDSKVIGGTPRRLVEWIMSKGDSFDILSLLLTYRKFLDTLDVLHIFRDLYTLSVTNADVKTINNLLLFLRQWATQYYRTDFKTNELKQEFWQMVETMAIPKQDLTQSLSGVLVREGSSHLAQTEAERRRSFSLTSTSSTTSLGSPASEEKAALHRLSKHHISTDFEEVKAVIRRLSLPHIVPDSDSEMKPVVQVRPKSHSADYEKGVHLLSRHHFVDYDEEMIFAELDYRVCSEFAQIQPLELVDMAWQKKDKENLAPNVLRLIKTFNDLSGWTASEILTAPSAKQQTAVLCHFIKIASIAVDKRNFDLVMAILSGLNNYSVSRVHCIWDAVPSKSKERLAQIQEIMKMDSNFKKYRELLRAAPNAMPYFALFLRDLAFASENTDYFENGLVNFEKSRILYAIVKELQNFQKVPQSPPSKTTLSLQSFLKNMDILEDQELYTHSIVIEPAMRASQRQSSSKKDLLGQVGVALVNNCMANNVTAVKNLLKETIGSGSEVVKYQNQHGETALHICASEGRRKLAVLLLEAGADCNAPNNEGNTALHLAASNNHLKVAKLLVEVGKANMMSVNEEKKTCIDVATPRVKSYLEVERLRPLIAQLKKPQESEQAMVWSESMSVGVQTFDNDHKHLIAAINQIIGTNAVEAIGNTLDFLTYYTEFHFANEETLFAKYNYPSSAAHKKEHIRLTEQVKQYNKLHKRGKVNHAELSKFLQGWLINHIMKEDMKYTDFFHTKGVF
eukprot:Phypoly_transcript_00714.p1 GENE.Phypoly_transcript_00714~~Phypoly_transcript_00714.p1  ORF type:complete len:1363 (-),score=185.53 Phypoly_transcript_00714:47-4135(-)